MASTYVNNLRLEEIGTGEQSGTWGDTTNTNLEIIGQAVAWGTRAIANDSTDNITIADGALDADRCLGLKLTGGGQACTVSLLPNTSSKTWFMYNATAAALTFTCGSGANVIIPAGQTKVIATDGLGSGGVVHDLLTAVNLAGTTVVDDLTVSDDLTVGDDLAVTGLATVGETLAVTGVLTTTAATVFNGGFASNANSTMGTDKKLIFRDSAIHISSTADGDMSIAADDEIDITSTLIDINGAVDMSSTLGVTGVVTANAGVVVDEMTLDGDTLTATDDFIIDAVGEISLDADNSGIIYLKDAGTIYGQFFQSSSDFYIQSQTSDKDIIFRGNDGGNVITALTLDMSDAGQAIFNSTLFIPQYIKHRDDTDTFFGFSGANELYFQTGNVRNLDINTGAVVFNESGANIDFRVESENHTDALFVDAGDDKTYFGKSSSALSAAGIECQTNGRFMATLDGGLVAQFNRLSSHGDIADFYKDGGKVGSIGSASIGGLEITGNNTGRSVLMTTNFFPANGAGAKSDNVIDLGVSDARWNDLHIGGTAHLTNSSSITGITTGASSLGITSGHTGSPLVLYIGQFGVSAAAGLTISTAREVTMPAQPSFHVVKNADQNNIAVGSNVTVVWQVESYDVGANFASNTFTAPVAGKYILTASIRVDSLDSTGSEHNDMAIVTSNRSYKNIFDLRGLSADPTYWTFTINAVADMDAGDTAYVQFYQDGGTAQSDIKNDSGRTYFSGILVG